MAVAFKPREIVETPKTAPKTPVYNNQQGISRTVYKSKYHDGFQYIQNSHKNEKGQVTTVWTHGVINTDIPENVDGHVTLYNSKSENPFTKVINADGSEEYVFDESVLMPVGSMHVAFYTNKTTGEEVRFFKGADKVFNLAMFPFTPRPDANQNACGTLKITQRTPQQQTAARNQPENVTSQVKVQQQDNDIPF